MSHKRKITSVQDGGDNKLAATTVSASSSSSSNAVCNDCGKPGSGNPGSGSHPLCRARRVCGTPSKENEWPLITDRLLDYITRGIGAPMLRDICRIVAQYATPVRERWVFILVGDQTLPPDVWYSTHTLAIATLAISADVSGIGDQCKCGRGNLVFTPMDTTSASITDWVIPSWRSPRLLVARDSTVFDAVNEGYTDCPPGPSDIKWFDPGHMGFSVSRSAPVAAVNVCRRAKAGVVELVSFKARLDPSQWPPADQSRSLRPVVRHRQRGRSAASYTPLPS